MKKFISLILSGIMLFTIPVFAEDDIETIKKRITEQKNQIRDEYKTNEIFIKGIDDLKTEQIIKNVLKDFDYTIKEQYSLSKAYLVSFPSVSEADRAIDLLNARSDIKYAQPNYRQMEAPVKGLYPSDWAKESIDCANEFGITKKSQEYLYQQRISREDFCELIYNFLIAVSKDEAVPFEEKFTDTNNKTILILHALGIVEGKSETEFAPNDNLTREEAAAIIVRMINNIMPMPATEQWFEFEDTKNISDWASESVQTICNLGFMSGVDDNHFAPKHFLTTEQAIAILVRIYKKAETDGIINDNTSIGIIGGADGPTKIVVSENIGSSDIHIDEFYFEEAIKLISESAELAADEEFIKLYTPDKEVAQIISEVGKGNYNKPVTVFYISADRNKIIENLKTLTDDKTIEMLKQPKYEKLWKKLNFSTLAGLINSSYGSEMVAALTILANNRGYVKPEDFENDFALYLLYNGGYSAIVSFFEYGDEVISSNMSFVKNGEKDNIWKRMEEISQGLGNEGLIIVNCWGGRATNGAETLQPGGA